MFFLLKRTLFGISFLHLFILQRSKSKRFPASYDPLVCFLTFEVVWYAILIGNLKKYQIYKNSQNLQNQMSCSAYLTNICWQDGIQQDNYAECCVSCRCQQKTHHTSFLFKPKTSNFNFCYFSMSVVDKQVNRLAKLN